MLKFGGTSVESAPRWRRIADVLRVRVRSGERPLVVCSAVAGVSDTLQELVAVADRGAPAGPAIDALCRRHAALGRQLELDIEPLIRAGRASLQRLLDRAPAGRLPAPLRAEVLATGELLSTRIGVRWLRERGLSVAWLDARTLLDAAPPLPGASPLQHYCDARCDVDRRSDLGRRLGARDADVLLTQGFIARNDAGETVLLGRGGSDTAAAYLAAILRAERLEIWTDVPGVFTCDPNEVSGASVVPRLSYDEAEALAGLGGRVLHPRAIHPVRQAGVPLSIRSTPQPDAPGTRVAAAPAGDGIKAVVSRRDLCLISVHRPAGWRPVGFLADVCECFKRHALPVDLLSSSPSRIRTTLDLPALLEDLGGVATPAVDRDVASVSVVGHRLQTGIHRLAPVLASLRDRSLLLLSHCASDLSLTMVVPRRRAAEVERLLHRQLFERNGPRARQPEVPVGA